MIDTLIARVALPKEVVPNPNLWGEGEEQLHEVELGGIRLTQYYSYQYGKRYAGVQFTLPEQLGMGTRELWQERNYWQIVGAMQDLLTIAFRGHVPIFSSWNVDRVDFCHDFVLEGADIGYQLRRLNRFVESQKFVKELIQNGETFYLKSKGKRPNRIRLYDKAKQLRAKGDEERAEEFKDVLRLEYQLVRESRALQRLRTQISGRYDRSPVTVWDVLDPEFAHAALSEAIENLGLSRGFVFGVKDARKVLREELGTDSKRYERLMGHYARCVTYGVDEWKEEVGKDHARTIRSELRRINPCLWPPSRKLVKFPIQLPSLEELTAPPERKPRRRKKPEMITVRVIDG